jgi:hypothetical protein
VSILRVGLVTLVLVLLGAGAVAVAVALDPGAKPLPARSMGPKQMAPAKALSPQQQKKMDEARKQVLAERKEYAKLRDAGASEKKLADQHAKVEKAQAALRALSPQVMPHRMAGGSCGGGASCSHGAKGEGKGGSCRMSAKMGAKDEGPGSCSHHATAGGCGTGAGGSCAMGAKEKSANHNAAAKEEKEAAAGKAGKDTGQQAGRTDRTPGHGGAAVKRGGDAAGHDGGHSGHGGAAKAQGA